MLLLNRFSRLTVRAIVEKHDDMTECAQELVDKEICVSYAEGRRLFIQLKNKEGNHGKPE